jgi:hypothetical protein
MSRLQKESLVLERRAPGEDLLENNELRLADEVRGADDEGNRPAPLTTRPSFFATLLRALSAWSV